MACELQVSLITMGISLLQPYNENRGENITHQLHLLSSPSLAAKVFEKDAIGNLWSVLFDGFFCYADHHFQTYRK